MKKCQSCSSLVEKKRRTCDVCKARIKKERWDRYYSTHKEHVRLRMREYEKREERRQSIGKRYQQMVNNARNNNRTCTITKEQFSQITNQPCHYCHDILCNSRTGSRIDRLDNSKGYELGNVVSCCKICNQIKQDLFDSEATTVMVQALIDHYVAKAGNRMI